MPSLGLSGGVRVVLEYANRLLDLGHRVNVVFPRRAPQKLYIGKIRYLLNTIKTNILDFRKPLTLDWFDLRAGLIVVPSLDLSLIAISKHLIPDSDVVLATSWETAYFVAALPLNKGEKFYFIQHYEIWDIWNNSDCWQEAQRIREVHKDPSIAMSFLRPRDPNLRKLKELVDGSYALPLKKITISKWLEDILNVRFGQRSYGVVTNGVNFDIFSCKEGNTLNNERRAILMPYRGVSWKGDLDGLEAFKKVYKIWGDSIDYWLFGSCIPVDYPPWIKIYEKPLDHQLRDLYCLAQIFVSPSWVEGFNLTPMEAMACKCAVVTTNVGAVPEFAVANETAIVVPPRDSNSLFMGISRLLENPAECSNIAKNGHDYVMQFTWDRSVKKFALILMENIDS